MIDDFDYILERARRNALSAMDSERLITGIYAKDLLRITDELYKLKRLVEEAIKECH